MRWLVWAGVGAGVGVGVNFLRPESESESLKFDRLRSPEFGSMQGCGLLSLCAIQLNFFGHQSPSDQGGDSTWPGQLVGCFSILFFKFSTQSERHFCRVTFLEYLWKFRAGEVFLGCPAPIRKERAIFLAKNMSGDISASSSLRPSKLDQKGSSTCLFQKWRTRTLVNRWIIICIHKLLKL